MASVSITRLRVRALRHMFSFMWHSLRSSRQVARAPGYLAGGTLMEKGGLIFWTVTVWSDDAAMRTFRNSGAHMKAMPRLIAICSEASYGHWKQDGSEVPSPDEIHRRMRELGKTSKVRSPTDAHREGQVATDVAPGKLRPIAPLRHLT